MTHASLHNGVMTLEDGTQIHGVTVELIEAAPELLQVLQEMCEGWTPQKPDSPYFNTYSKASEAIAKATGKYQPVASS